MAEHPPKRPGKTDTRTIPGATRAAILLLLLGEQAGAEVFKHLNDVEIKTISQEISKLRQVEPDIAEAIINFCHRTLVQQKNVRGGIEYTKRVLESAFNPDLARKILRDVEQNLNADVKGVQILQQAKPAQLAKLLQLEHPQVISLVLSSLDPNRSAATINELPEELRTDVCMRLAKLENVPGEMRTRVIESVASRLGEAPSAAAEKLGGVRKVAEIFNKMDRELSRAFLEEIENENPNLALSIRNNMFVFDDILLVSDHDMRKILQNIDKQLLIKALRGTHEELREHFFRNMSERAVEILKEDMEALGPVRVREVEAAQQEVVNVIRQLESEGTIEIGGGADDYVL